MLERRQSYKHGSLALFDPRRALARVSYTVESDRRCSSLKGAMTPLKRPIKQSDGGRVGGDAAVAVADCGSDVGGDAVRRLIDSIDAPVAAVRRPRCRSRRQARNRGSAPPRRSRRSRWCLDRRARRYSCRRWKPKRRRERWPSSRARRESKSSRSPSLRNPPASPNKRIAAGPLGSCIGEQHWNGRNKWWITPSSTNPS